MHTPIPSFRRLNCAKWSRLVPLLLLSGGLAPLLPQAAYAQVAGAHTVSGKITSANGEGIPGVTIVVKGTTNGTTTDVDGKYTISVPNDNSVLVLSSVGFAKQELAVGSRTTINQSLEAENQALEEVKVIGYGTQRAEAVTGSVASISGDNLREVPVANVGQALQGRLPGVQISQNSSQPGASPQIRIRGTRSLTASNDPLIVLDGIPFPGSLGDINPNDIQSVDILKDASATAIYGSRGANGVVLVTTKGGKKGQKPQVTYSGFVGIKTLFAKYPMMDGGDFVALRKAAGIYNNGVDESNDVNVDWQDLLYRTGIQNNQNVGLNGGTESGRYNFNAGYYKEQGVIPTQQYTRFSIRGTLDQNVGKYVRLGFTTNNSYSLSEGNNVGIYGALSSSPIANPYNADGSLKRTIKMPLDENWITTRQVVEANQDKWLSQTRNFATYNAIFGEFKMPGVEGLKYRINLGVNYRQTQGGSYTGVGINAVNPTTVSTASVSNSVTTDYTVENILSYDRTFGGKHNINALALYSASNNVFNRSQIDGRDIPADAFQFYNIGRATSTNITVNPNNQQYQKSGLLSYMARVMYSYDDRYLISATMRADGSSRLAPGNKWNTYPAVSVGWNIAKESFMQGIEAVNMLKLRAGYGITSNQSVNPYATLGLLDTRPYNFGPTGYDTGLFVNQLPNPSLGWEYSRTWNYAIDFAFLKNRLSGTVEYYVTNTRNLLLGLPLAPTSGVSGYTANIGSTQNKGIELSLNGVILDNLNGWTWEAGVNLYANRNQITALAGEQTRDEGNWWFVGKPINVVFDYEKVGLWQQGDQYLNILEPGGNVGMIKVKYTGTYNADGSPTRAIGSADRQILDINPKFLGGFNTRLAYKGFDLSVVGVFQNGGLLNSTIYGSGGYLNMLNGRRGNVKVDYWTPDNTGAKYPKPGGLTSGDNPKYASTLGYFDASYLKIRTISLGYNVQPSDWMTKSGVSRLRLYVTAQNPFVFFSPYKKESGMDPETNSNGDQNAAVPLSGNLSRILTLGTNSPATRAFLAGLDLTF
jgi:TonB-linked SusC/RagA family outer membrane protein